MVIGIHREGSILYIATVEKGRLLETTTCSIEDVKPFDSPTITGLGFDQVLRRELSFKLRRRSQILSAIPFQAEGVIPYPLSDALLYPELIPSKTGTVVVLLATKKNFLDQHIADFQSIGIDPVQVASLPTALAKWAQFTHPEKTDVALFYGRSCVVCQKGKIVFSQSFEEKDRLKAFLQTKFPQAEPLPVDAMALAIGLALDTVQWRIGSHISDFSRRQKKRETHRFITAALILAATVWGAGEGFLAYHRHQLEKRLGGGPLQEKIATTLQDIQEKKKELPLAPPSYLVSDFLAYLASQSSDIDIMNVHYTYRDLEVKVELTFLAPTPAAARLFREQMAQVSKQTVKLSPDQDHYKMALSL